MLCPVAHTDPAELMLALGAGHMVATLIFFDGPLAFRARLRVSREPSSVLALRTLFLDPKLRGLAVTRTVRHVATLEAEFSAAVA